MDVDDQMDIEVNGRAYRLVCTPWPYETGRNWAIRLVSVLGQAARMTHHARVDTGAVLGGAGPEVLSAFVDQCEAHTTVVVLDTLDAPKPKVLDFKEFRPFLQARFDVTARLVRRHAEINFGPFFSSLSDVLKVADKEAKGGEQAA